MSARQIKKSSQKMNTEMADRSDTGKSELDDPSTNHLVPEAGVKSNKSQDQEVDLDFSPDSENKIEPPQNPNTDTSSMNSEHSHRPTWAKNLVKDAKDQNSISLAGGLGYEWAKQDKRLLEICKKYDVDGSGTLDGGELRLVMLEFIEERDFSKKLRRKIFFLLVWLILQSFTIFGLTIAAIYMSKETENDEKGVIVDKNTGKPALIGSADSSVSSGGVMISRDGPIGTVVKTQSTKKRMVISPTTSTSSTKKLADGSPAVFDLKCVEVVSALEDCAKNNSCNQQMMCPMPDCTRLSDFNIEAFGGLPTECTTGSLSSACTNTVCAQDGPAITWQTNDGTRATDLSKLHGNGQCAAGICMLTLVDAPSAQAANTPVRMLSGCAVGVPGTGMAVPEGAAAAHGRIAPPTTAYMPHRNALLDPHANPLDFFSFQTSVGTSYRCPDALTTFWTGEKRRLAEDTCGTNQDDAGDTKTNRRQCLVSQQAEKCDCLTNWLSLFVSKKRRGSIVEIADFEGEEGGGSYARFVDEDLGMFLVCSKEEPARTLPIKDMGHPSDFFDFVVEFEEAGATYPNSFGMDKKLRLPGETSPSQPAFSVSGNELEAFRFCWAERATCAFVDDVEVEAARSLSTGQKRRQLKRSC